jgi:hypothetical protein
MLDKIPAEARHILIMLLAAVLGWASDNILNLGLPPLVASLAGVVVGTLILWVTPMTRQYGIGKDTNDGIS